MSKKYSGEGNPHFGIHTNYNSTGFLGHKHSDNCKLLASKRFKGKKSKSTYL